MVAGARDEGSPGIGVTKLELLLSASALEPRRKAFGTQTAKLGKALFAGS
jgi:hypothetical protein